MAKILIADDSRFQVGLLSKSLEESGFEVVSALDALQAWMFALRSAPDAIVLDINMPGGSGIDVLRRLRISTKTLHIPVVVVSGSTEDSIEQLAKRLGAAEFFHKPVDPGRLVDTLRHLLSPQRVDLGSPPRANVSKARCFGPNDREEIDAIQAGERADQHDPAEIGVGQIKLKRKPQDKDTPNRR